MAVIPLHLWRDGTFSASGEGKGVLLLMITETEIRSPLGFPVYGEAVTRQPFSGKADEQNARD